MAYCRGSQNDWDLCHKTWQVWDHQGYLVFVIALDSIHLNPYDNIAQMFGQCIPQAYTGDLSAY